MTPQQLRNSILQMAIEGKLTRQLPEDGNATDLLKKIKAEKARLIKEKKIKKEKPLPEIRDDEVPFEVPENWCWVRLNDVGNWKAGATPSRDNPKYYGGSIPWLKTGDLNDGYIKFSSEYITNEAVDSNSLRLNPVGSVLMAMYGATIGKLGILQIAAATNQACCACVPYCGINNKYVFYFLLANRKKFIKLGSGGAQPNISRQKIIGYVVPLPPAAEQKRIVARLEEILTLVDEYEKAYNELQELNKKFPVNLKNSLLQMAIEGKLVEQCPEDGSAADLLKQIKAEKAKLIKEKKIKKENPLPPISDDEVPFEIPDNWCWVRLDDLIVKDIKRGKSPVYASQGSTMVFAQKCNTKYNGIDIKLSKYLDDNVLDRYPDSEFIKNGDIIINSTGIGTMGRVGFYNAFKDNINRVPLVPDSHVTVVRVSSHVFTMYIYNVLKCLQPYLESQGDGSTKQKELKASIIQNVCIPLPPLDEQKRIVDRLEQLLSLCEELKC